MRAGRFVFAAILIALGIWCVVRGSPSPVWAPAPVSLAYPCAAVSIACGAGSMWPRTPVIAARVLVAALAIWIAVFRVREIVRAPGVFGSWDGYAETLAITAAAAALALPDRAAIGRVLLGVCMIPFGLAHFIYPHETATIVPAWMPAHLAWAYATGGAFLAAGAAMLAGVRARLAAALAAAQMGGFTLLVWVPLVARGATSAFVWSELGISAALTAAAWVVSDSLA
jgi:hypothetical protein